MNLAGNYIQTCFVCIHTLRSNLLSRATKRGRCLHVLSRLLVDRVPKMDKESKAEPRSSDASLPVLEPPNKPQGALASPRRPRHPLKLTSKDKKRMREAKIASGVLDKLVAQLLVKKLAHAKAYQKARIKMKLAEIEKTRRRPRVVGRG